MLFCKAFHYAVWIGPYISEYLKESEWMAIQLLEMVQPMVTGTDRDQDYGFNISERPKGTGVDGNTVLEMV